MIEDNEAIARRISLSCFLRCWAVDRESAGLTQLQKDVTHAETIGAIVEKCDTKEGPNKAWFAIYINTGFYFTEGTHKTDDRNEPQRIVLSMLT